MPAMLRFVEDRKFHRGVPGEDLFEAIFNVAPIGIAILSLDGVIQRVNTELAAMMRRSNEELCGLSFTAITHPKDVGRDVQLYKSLLRGDIPSYAISKTYLTPREGGEVHALLTATVVRDKNRRPLYVIGMVVDESEVDHLREELSIAHENLHENTRKITSKIESLEQQNDVPIDEALQRLSDAVEDLKKERKVDDDVG